MELAKIAAPDIPNIEAQVGKNNHIEDNLVKVEKIDLSTKQEAESISNTYYVPWWAMIITAGCGILVYPMGMYRDWKEIRNA
jgi:ABC-type multidrug transport system permease subunit